MPERDVQIGAVLAGKYRVERVLGQGGMGVVVEATQVDLDRRVALKFLRAAATPESNAALTRFEREARTVARLRGAHVVQVYDVGRLDHGEPFIVMELLDGEDLSQLLDRETRLAIATAVDYVLQACEAMAEAHVAGVVHRDLKPANLFLSMRADGRPLLKVLDFGISKLVAETTSVNLTSGALGSPLYMSPEQLGSAKDIDHRTDVWSLGAILYELLSGKPAFDAEGLPQVCTRILLGAPDPIRQLRPEVSVELEQVLLRALRRYPDERYLSVADLAAGLLPFARKGAIDAAEATIRIVQASSLPHGALPRLSDSLPPPAFDATRPSATLGTDKTVLSGPPSSVRRDVERSPKAAPSAAQTVNVSGAPPALAQTDLKPLVAPLRDSSRAPGAHISRPVFWGGIAMIATLAAFAGVTLARRAPESIDSASPEPTQSKLVTAPAAAAAAPPASAVLASSAAVPPAASASALPEPPPKTAPKTTPPRAPKKPKRETPAEDMLDHR